MYSATPCVECLEELQYTAASFAPVHIRLGGQGLAEDFAIWGHDGDASVVTAALNAED